MAQIPSALSAARAAFNGDANDRIAAMAAARTARPFASAEFACGQTGRRLRARRLRHRPAALAGIMFAITICSGESRVTGQVFNSSPASAAHNLPKILNCSQDCLSRGPKQAKASARSQKMYDTGIRCLRPFASAPFGNDTINRARRGTRNEPHHGVQEWSAAKMNALEILS